MGSADGTGPSALGEVSALAVDAAARVYVLDRSSESVKVFDSVGGFVRAFGRPGKGPGELSGAVGLGWSPEGNLWVVDQMNARYDVFDTAGRSLTSHPRPMTMTFTDSWDGKLDRSGRICEPYVLQKPTRTGIVRFDTTLKAIDTLIVPPYEGQTFSGKDASIPVPFSPKLAWVVDGQGQLWFGVTSPYRIYRTGPKGDTALVIERSVADPVPVTTMDKDTFMVTAKKLEGWLGFKIDTARFPKTKPAFSSFAIDDAGNLWVEPSVRIDQGRVLDVFDPRGRYLGRVRSPFPIDLASHPVFVGDRIYVVGTSPEGAQLVIRARIVRHGR
jgi:sugar lactone lactonase YvrE